VYEVSIGSWPVVTQYVIKNTVGLYAIPANSESFQILSIDRMMWTYIRIEKIVSIRPHVISPKLLNEFR